MLVLSIKDGTTVVLQTDDGQVIRLIWRRTHRKWKLGVEAPRKWHIHREKPSDEGETSVERSTST